MTAQAKQEILKKEEWQPIAKKWKGTEEEERSFSESFSSNNSQPEPYHYQSEIYKGKNWKCPIYRVEDHYRHWRYSYCNGIVPKDRSYIYRRNLRCSCIKEEGRY